MGSVFGLQKRQAFPEPPIPPFPGGPTDYVTGNDVNLSTALAVPAAYACILLLSGQVGSLELRTYKQAPDFGAVKRVADPPLLVTPNGKMTQSAWLQQATVSLIEGNIYGHILERDSYERASRIDVMSPDKLQVTEDDAGNLTFKVRKTQKIIPNSDMWHVPGLTLPGDTVGVSPITYAAASLNIDISSRKFASDFFAGGGIPKAILTTDQYVDRTKAQTIKDRFLAAIRGREPMVFGNGVKFQQISVRPEESQFLKTQEANVAQVARYFGVPPEMIGGSGGNSMTYANVEQRSLDFLTYSLRPWLIRIEQAISNLLPRGVFVKFYTDDLLRTDAETRAKIDVQHVAAKILAPSEIRERDGLPPMTEAQKTEVNLVPLTITPLGGPKALPGAQPLGEPAPVPAADQQSPQTGQ